MRIGIGIIMLAISIVTTGEGSLVKREAPEAIFTLWGSYTGAYEAGQISHDLYEVVEDFLEETEKRFVTEDIVEVYNDFPDDYVRRLIEYSESAMNGLQEEKDKEARAELKREYNADMRYIQKELAIYGVHVDFELSEEEFEKALAYTPRHEQGETDEKSN